MTINLQTITDILKLIATSLPFIIAAATYIAANAKNKKLKRKAENWAKIAKAAQVYVADAEQFVNFAGTEKKEWVITKINQYAIDKGIEFDARQASALIEDIVQLSKKVNGRDKDLKPIEKKEVTLP